MRIGTVGWTERMALKMARHSLSGSFWTDMCPTSSQSCGSVTIITRKKDEHAPRRKNEGFSAIAS